MKATLSGWLRRVQSSGPVRVAGAYGRSQASGYALALAFAGFMSMFPMMLGALSIVGLAIRDPATDAHAQSLLLQLFPPSAQPELEQALRGVKQSAGWFGLISFVGLLWSAGNIYGTMEFALTQIFNSRRRSLVQQRLMGLAMLLLLVVVLVVLVAVNDVPALLPVASWLTWTIGFGIGAAVMVVLLVVLYLYVPNRSASVRDVLPGALLAGVLVEVLSLGFPLYAKLAGGFNTYGAQFALFFVLATWFYLLSQLLLFGAVYNRYRLDERRRDPFPKAGARSRTR